MTSTAQQPIEIRRNKDTTLDEVVASGASVHLEQMSATHWWMAIEKDGIMIHVNFHSRTKITAEASNPWKIQNDK